MFCGVEKANYVLLRAHQFHRWPYKDRGNHEDSGGMRIVTTFRVFCDIGHDVKSAVHMGCVTSGGLVEQFHSPFPLCCAMSSAWKFLAQVQRDAVQHVASTSMPILDSTDRAGRVVVRYTRCSLWTCYRLC